MNLCCPRRIAVYRLEVDCCLSDGKAANSMNMTFMSEIDISVLQT